MHHPMHVLWGVVQDRWVLMVRCSGAIPCVGFSSHTHSGSVHLIPIDCLSDSCNSSKMTGVEMRQATMRERREVWFIFSLYNNFIKYITRQLIKTKTRAQFKTVVPEITRFLSLKNLNFNRNMQNLFPLLEQPVIKQPHNQPNPMTKTDDAAKSFHLITPQIDQAASFH